MNRLQSELNRLYLLPGAAPTTPALVHAGEVRALVIELGRPADWAALSAVWRGAQADLHLPAPGIAVQGRDGMQLWFSLEVAVSAARAAAFLAQLRRRYLAGVDAERLRLFPSSEVSNEPPGEAPALPPQPTGPDQW